MWLSGIRNPAVPLLLVIFESIFWSNSITAVNGPGQYLFIKFSAMSGMFFEKLYIWLGSLINSEIGLFLSLPLIEKIFPIFSGLVPSMPKAKNVSVGKAIGSLSNIDLVNNEIFFVNIAICNNYLIYSIISRC